MRLIQKMVLLSLLMLPLLPWSVSPSPWPSFCMLMSSRSTPGGVQLDCYSCLGRLFFALSSELGYLQRLPVSWIMLSSLYLSFMGFRMLRTRIQPIPCT